MGRYDAYNTGKHLIEIDGITNELYAKPDDYGEFIKMINSYRTGKELDMKPIVDFTVKLVKAGTTKSEVEEMGFEDNLRRYLWKNIGVLADELMVAFGIVKRGELDKFKADALELVKKKSLQEN